MSTPSNTVTSAVELATRLTIAWLDSPNARATAQDAATFLTAMRDSLLQLTERPDAAGVADAPSASFVPAVSVRKSLASRDHIISLIDGKPYKALRRHLSSHGLTAEEYRRRYNLKADYPMVAEAYSAERRAMAKRIGLGRKPGLPVVVTKSTFPSRRTLKLPAFTG